MNSLSFYPSLHFTQRRERKRRAFSDDNIGDQLPKRNSLFLSFFLSFFLFAFFFFFLLLSFLLSLPFSSFLFLSFFLSSFIFLFFFLLLSCFSFVSFSGVGWPCLLCSCW